MGRRPDGARLPESSALGIIPAMAKQAGSKLAIGVLAGLVLVLSALLFRSNRSPEASARQSLRPAIEAEIEKETAGLDTEGAVDAYLDRLERRARAQGKVTAVEIEPGMVAIQRLGAVLGHKAVMEKQARFGDRMQKLQSELGRGGS